MAVAPKEAEGERGTVASARSKPRRLVVAQSKGGVGKTITACNLAYGLAAAGSNVLLVDTDTQGQTAPFLGVSPPAGLAQLLTESSNGAMHEARPRLSLLSGGRELAGVKRLLTQREIGAEKAIQEALEPHESGFDFVIIDTSPGWDSLTIAALFYAEEVLAPVSMEAATLLGLLEFRKRLEDVQKYQSRLRFRYVLPTMYDRRVKKSEEILSQLREHFGDLVLSPIRYNVRLSECVGYGKTIFEYDKRSTGAEDYGSLVRDIITD